MRILPTLGLILLAVPVASYAAGECREKGHITGHVNTVNLGLELQYGIATVHIEKNEKTFYEGEGVIIGQAATVGGDGLPTSLNHTIFFSDGKRLNTYGDAVDPSSIEWKDSCHFEVTETITNAEGTKKLNQLTSDNHDISVEGTVGICPDDPRNSFGLSGYVCFD
jgi:hypothetical protein